MFRFLISSLTFLCGTVSACVAHDLWIETNTSFVRNKEVVNVAFKLGNCDEGRRDFKTKGLIDKDGTVVESISPSQQRVDLTSSLARSSNDPRGGYWTSVCPVDEIGTNWFTLAFITGDGGGAPAWGGI